MSLTPTEEAVAIAELRRLANEYQELKNGALDDVRTGESRAPVFSPETYRATITPMPDGRQMINIMSKDQPIPAGSRVIDPVE